MSKAWIKRGTAATEAGITGLVLRQLPQHMVCAALGWVGGAAGVALAIGLVISLQLLLPPAYALSIGVVPLMVIAAIAGLLVSWLLGRLAHRSLPHLLESSDERGLQVILVFSVFTSLLQILLFFTRM